MSVFGKQIRRVRDESLPETTRLIAFVVALNAFGLRTNRDSAETLDRLGDEFGFSRERPPSIAQALAAGVVLERERNTFVEAERGFARRRVREKARGRQRVSDADRERWISRERFEPVPRGVRDAWLA